MAQIIIPICAELPVLVERERERVLLFKINHFVFSVITNTFFLLGRISSYKVIGNLKQS